ncbi:hypothetical protein DRE_07655 [Drechslerella stenobrocha 248]|uniref:Uncharacterized protein n=1 Tax=Drechslerella stenobrocha 248 TaxID=1043628 RepID=W7HTX4_9PEZI|nr:hypothetical protein DRE_07655 [Drechslerella stenobrocha 248]
MFKSLFCLGPPPAPLKAHRNGAVVLKASSFLPDVDDDDRLKRHSLATPPRVSEKARNVDRNETCVLNHPFAGSRADETLVFSLGPCDLDSVTHPDYLTISMLDRRNLAELEINISRYSRTVAFNQQNPNETWKKEHICELEELLEHGAPNEIRIWTEERVATDGFRWREYIVGTPRRRVATEIVAFGVSPKVRFLQIYERSDPPMLEQSRIEVSHYNHEVEKEEPVTPESKRGEKRHRTEVVEIKDDDEKERVSTKRAHRHSRRISQAQVPFP